MRYLKTPEGVQHLSSTSWLQQKLSEWVSGEPLTEFANSVESQTLEFLEYLQGAQISRDFKYFSRLSASNPKYAKSPLYVTSLIKLPWNIHMLAECNGKKCNPLF